MRHKIFLFLCIFAILSLYSDNLKPYIIKPSRVNDINVIYSLGGEIQNSSKDHIKFYSNQQSIDKIIAHGYTPIELVDTNLIILEYEKNRLDQKNEEEDWTSYHSYDGLTTHLAELESDYSDIVKVFSIGESVAGRDIWCLKISDNVDEHENEPSVLYISSIHGDEPIGMELTIALAESLVEYYLTDTRLTNIVNNTELYLIPLHNPDGWENSPYPVRRNNNGVDLNRNFPVVSGVIGDDGTFDIEIENQHLINFIQDINFSFVIDFHTGALVVNYPWDYDSFTFLPDSELIAERAIDYSFSNSRMYLSSSFDNGVIFGAWWYQVQGTLEDWNYWFNGNIHYIVELYDIKMPFASSLSSIWEDNYEAYLYLIERAQEGIHITVRDTLTMEPLKANIIVDGLPWTYQSDSLVGDFHRELLEGYYDIEVSKEGYNTKNIYNIFVPDDGSVNIDVYLMNTDFSISEDFSISDCIYIYPNPFNNLCQITTGYRTDMLVYDINGNLITQSLNLRSHVWKPSQLVNSGVYFVRIQSDSAQYSRKILYIK